jgi:hypothetical protein
MLNNWKTTVLGFLLALAFSWGGVLQIKLIFVQRENQVCRSELSNLKTANRIAYTEYQKQMKDNQQKEQAAIKANAETQKKMDKIKNDRIDGGCMGAIQYGIQSASKLF